MSENDDIQTMPGHLIRRMHQVHQSVFSSLTSVAGFDITSVQFAALNALARYGEMDQATLAGAIAYDKATIGSVVDRLESKAWVARRQSELDRRARIVAITEKGLAMLDSVSPVVREIQVAMLPGLDSSEREELLRLLSKVTYAGNELSRAPYRPPATSKR